MSRSTGAEFWIKSRTKMADVESLLRRPAGANGRRPAPDFAVELIGRFRKPLVALWLMAGDAIAVCCAVACSYALFSLRQPPLLRSFFAIPLLIGIFWAFGLYSGVGPSPYERFSSRLRGVLGFAVVECAYGAPAGELGRLLVAASVDAALLLALGHYAEAATRSLMIRAGVWGARTAVVGCDESGRKLARTLLSEPALGLAPVGFIATRGESASNTQGLALPMIGTTADLRSVRDEVEVAILTSAEDAPSFAEAAQKAAPEWRLLLAENAEGLPSLWARTRTLGSAIGIELRFDLGQRRSRVLKRAFDLAVAVPAALLVAPIVGVAALAIQCVDPGPPFYRQERIGRNGALFRMLKLRSMYRDAEQRLAQHLCADPRAREEWRQYFKLRRDPRVLPLIGRFLRCASIDELPQLWNVIRGDMSLVGPRPLPTYHLDSFDSGFRTLRAAVRPGMTGLWQVSARGDTDADAVKAQDLFYLRNWSILLDAYVLLETLPAVLSGRGAR